MHQKFSNAAKIHRLLNDTHLISYDFRIHTFFTGETKTFKLNLHHMFHKWNYLSYHQKCLVAANNRLLCTVWLVNICLLPTYATDRHVINVRVMTKFMAVHAWCRRGDLVLADTKSVLYSWTNCLTHVSECKQQVVVNEYYFVYDDKLINLLMLIIR